MSQAQNHFGAVEQVGSEPQQGVPSVESALHGHLTHWLTRTSAIAGGLWWIEAGRAVLCAHSGFSAEQLLAVEAHPEWLIDAPLNSIGAPQPDALAGWREAGLPNCRLRAALASASHGNALMLLLCDAEVEDSQSPGEADQRALRESGPTLVRDVEIAYLRLAAQQQQIELAAERKVFMAGKVVVFKWRNEVEWPVEYVSPNVAEVLGYTEQEWLSGKIQYGAIVHEDDMPRVAAEVREAVEANRQAFTHVDYRVRRKDGQLRWLYDHTSVVRNERGEVTHFLGYILDITDRRIAAEERVALESKMQQTQKLESLGVLTGGLAHDFNNLLVGVLGNADLALSEVQPGSEVAGYLEAVNLAARRAADLVRQMLAYSGKGRFHIETFDLRTVIEEMTHLLEAAISKKILLRFQFEDAAPILRADTTQMRQVVMNLITNASDAIGTRNGLVTVRTGVRSCSSEFLAGARVLGSSTAEGDYAFIEVNDTGCGMDADTQDLIFDPFYSTKFAGRGLGLAAVQGIVRGHDGALFLKSSRGGGTTFKLFFPNQAHDAPSHDDAPEAPRSPRKVVLLVDDEETVRAVARRMLEQLDFEVVIAHDGSEALDVFRSDPQRFDLVLLDLTMPNMGGEDCLRELRMLRPQLRTILSSGFTEPESLVQLSQTGRTTFLQKPYDKEQLTAAVSLMLKTN